MLKLYLSIVLLSGLAIACAAGYAQAMAGARAASIICNIAGLRNDRNVRDCERVEMETSEQLNRIRDSFEPIIWLGIAVAGVSVLGLGAVSWKKQSDSSLEIEK